MSMYSKVNHYILKLNSSGFRRFSPETGLQHSIIGGRNYKDVFNLFDSLYLKILKILDSQQRNYKPQVPNSLFFDPNFIC